MASNDDDQWSHLFEIEETMQDAKGSHTLYKIVYKLFPKNAIEPLTEVTVWKRYNDIKLLHKLFQKMHHGLHLKGTFPALPESRLFGRYNDDVIEGRKKAALELLDFVSKFQILRENSLFKDFFSEGKLVSVDPAERDPAEPLRPQKLNTGGSSSSLDESSLVAYVKKLGHQRCFSEPPKIAHEEQQLFDPLLSRDVCVNDDKALLASIDLHPASTSCDNLQSQSPPAVAETLVFVTDTDASPVVTNELDGTPHISDFGDNIDTAVKTYIVDAATLISQAKQHEEAEEYEAAFESYKCAVGILLQGVKGETDPERRSAIKKKTCTYLAKAEQIYEECISSNIGIRSKWAPDSPFKFYPQLVNPVSSEDNIHSLKHLKVVDVIENVQLVKNVITNQLYIIKVVPKPPILKSCPRFPREISNMVQLYRVYETKDAYFLLLQYASGGRLWDHVFGKGFTLLSPCPDCTFQSSHNDEMYNMILSRSLTDINEFEDDNYYNNDLNADYQNIPSRVDSYTGSLASIDSLDIEDNSYSKNYLDLCTSYLDGSGSSCDISYKTISSVTEPEPKASFFGRRKTSAQKFKVSTAVESFGITSLLHKAKELLKNADEALRQTRLADSFGVRHLKNSQSEIDISKKKKHQMSEVFHQCGVNESSTRKQVPENRCKQWLYQIAMALSQLHNLGIHFYSLNPKNVLIDSNQEQILLTYKCNVFEYHSLCETFPHAVYCAPEFIESPSKVNYQADWWSFGALAYELLTYRSLASFFPRGFTAFDCDRIYYPNFISVEAKDFLSKLLEYNPLQRLGRYGDEEVLTHPFFYDIESVKSGANTFLLPSR